MYFWVWRSALVSKATYFLVTCQLGLLVFPFTCPWRAKRVFYPLPRVYVSVKKVCNCHFKYQHCVYEAVKHDNRKPGSNVIWVSMSEDQTRSHVTLVYSLRVIVTVLLDNSRHCYDISLKKWVKYFRSCIGIGYLQINIAWSWRGVVKLFPLADLRITKKK